MLYQNVGALWPQDDLSTGLLRLAHNVFVHLCNTNLNVAKAAGLLCQQTTAVMALTMRLTLQY